MSQQIQDRNSGWPRTLHGFERAEEATPDRASGEPKFVAIGARVGRSGQVFETDGGGGRLVKLFTWAAGLPADVVRDFTGDVIRVADLRHPNVAQVFDAGILGDGTPFVVMERLAGMKLDEATSGSSLPMAEVLAILRGVASALSAAHAVGVAHGQVRADNVFIAGAATNGLGHPKLLDFGVTRLVPGAQEIGRGVHALGPRAAERADQLALATLAWRLSRPISAPGIERVLMRAMSPDPSQRFGSVTVLVEALEEASVRGVAAGLTMNMRTRTVAGAAPPISQRGLAVAAVAPPAAPLAAAPPPADAPPPAPPSAPASLTQQFFAHGEQLDIEHAAGGTETEEDEERQLETEAVATVPRSRAQMTAAALLALGSIALIGWTIVSLVSEPEGVPRVADTSPATVVVRPVAVSPARPPRPARSTDRRPEGKTPKTTLSRRTPPNQPPPFAAPTRSVTASEAPTPPTLAVPPPPTAAPPPDPAGVAAPSVERAARTGLETQPEEPLEDEPRDPEPGTGTAGAASVAPPASDDVSPAPSAPEPAAPSDHAQ